MSRVRVTINGQTFTRVARAAVRTDLLELADSWEVTLEPVSRRVLALAHEDAGVTISVESTTLITGFVDEVNPVAARTGRTVTIRGRDRAGRLVDEGMPLGRLGDLDLVALGKRVAGPWFAEVTLSNTTNRRLVRGRGTKVPSGGEPIFDRRADAQLRVEPGQTRADVLRHFLEPARLLAWSDSTGTALVIGKPNANQGPQYLLDSRRVVSVNETRSVAERGATYTAYLPDRLRVTERGVDPRGSFQRPKAITIAGFRSRNRAQLRRELDAEIARRTQQAESLSLSVVGFGERYSHGQEQTLFAPDTIARVRLPRIGVDGDYLVTAVQYLLNNREATSELTLVPADLEVFA